ncbi:MAG: hypothetical protein V7609_2174 [Verrucomicrobiota bacterium]
MRTILRSILLLAALFATSAILAVPTVDITVKQRAGGKIVKQVKSDSAGTFSLGRLPAGRYSVEFRAASSSQSKEMEFSIAIDGIKTTSQSDVSGGSLVGGVNVNVEVGPPANVVGLILVGPNVAARRMIYLRPTVGSNMPGKWVAKGSIEAVPARNQGYFRLEDVRKWQDHGDVGH